MDPPLGSIIYTIGALESRIRASVFGILPGLWARARKSEVLDAAEDGDAEERQRSPGAGQLRSVTPAWEAK